MEEFYKNTSNNIPYNPLSVGDIVLVEFISHNPYYHNLYIDIVKSIDIDSDGYEVCRLQSFNYDIKLDVITEDMIDSSEEEAIKELLEGGSVWINEYDGVFEWTMIDLKNIKNKMEK